MATEENRANQLDLSPFKVQSRREISSLLRALSEQKQLIRILIEATGESAVTSILDVDDDAGVVILDTSPNPAVIEHLIASDNLSFETVLDRIRILFFANRIEECTHDELPALQIAIPSHLIRLQRREFYRVPTPIKNPVHCTIHIVSDDGTQTVTLPLQNVSGGGIAINDEKHLLDRTVGKIYPDCQIYLPDNTVVITTLQIRNVIEVRTDQGKSIQRIGCVFVGLPKAMLAAIQRYITRLERDQNAKSTGLL